MVVLIGEFPGTSSFRHVSPKDAKAALEIQDQILQKAEINKSDEQWLKEVVTALAASTKDFQAMFS